MRRDEHVPNLLSRAELAERYRLSLGLMLAIEEAFDEGVVVSLLCIDPSPSHKGMDEVEFKFPRRRGYLAAARKLGLALNREVGNFRYSDGRTEAYMPRRVL